MLDKSHECVDQATGTPCPIHQGPIGGIEVVMHINAGMGWTRKVLKPHGILDSNKNSQVIFFNTASKKTVQVLSLSQLESKYGPIRKLFTMPAHTFAENYFWKAFRHVVHGLVVAHTWELGNLKIPSWIKASSVKSLFAEKLRVNAISN